jgi:Helix-turn-helix domain
MKSVNRRQEFIQEIARAVINLLNDRFSETVNKQGAAEYLKISISTLETKLREIPHSKVGRNLVFCKRDLNAYLERKRCVNIGMLVDSLINNQTVSRRNRGQLGCQTDAKNGRNA